MAEKKAKKVGKKSLKMDSKQVKQEKKISLASIKNMMKY